MNFKFDRILYGGSFDPPHLGHLGIIKFLLENNFCKTLDLVPTYISPLKENFAKASAENRLEMLELLKKELIKTSFVNNERVIIQKLEIEREGKSYTYDTCKELEKIYPNQTFTILIGADLLTNFHLWFRLKDLVNNYKFLIYTRLDENLQKDNLIEKINLIKEKFSNFNYDILKDVPLSSFSSTEIRKNIKNTNSDLLCPAGLIKDIWNYIVKNNLYK